LNRRNLDSRRTAGLGHWRLWTTDRNRRCDRIGVRVGECRSDSSGERCQRDHHSRRKNSDSASLTANLNWCSHMCVFSSELQERGGLTTTAAMRNRLPRHWCGPAGAATLRDVVAVALRPPNTPSIRAYRVGSSCDIAAINGDRIPLSSRSSLVRPMRYINERRWRRGRGPRWRHTSHG
jgi:hypothetical protein